MKPALGQAFLTAKTAAEDTEDSGISAHDEGMARAMTANASFLCRFIE